jgi:competence protein ComEA
MSFYRTLFATIAAATLISPVLANDDNANNNPAGQPMQVAASDQAETTTTTTTTTTQTKINLNSATAKELMKVDGINAAKARAIISYRKKHGEFKSLDELSNVKGLKKLDSNTLQNIQNQLTIE